MEHIAEVEKPMKNANENSINNTFLFIPEFLNGNKSSDKTKQNSLMFYFYRAVFSIS